MTAIKLISFRFRKSSKHSRGEDSRKKVAVRKSESPSRRPVKEEKRVVRKRSSSPEERRVTREDSREA